MASSSYDPSGVESGAGAGGKFRKRPFRRVSTTPYNRPQLPNPKANTNPNNGGWVSKLIGWSASKILPSVFQKRLTAPTAAQSTSTTTTDENLLSGHKPPEAVSNELKVQKTSDKAIEPVVKARENIANDYETQKETLPRIHEFFEVEQLLKQKTFTRAESERLTDLLRSRVVESSTSQLPLHCDYKEEEVVTEKVKHKGKSITEPSTSRSAVSYEKKGKAIALDNEILLKTSTLHGDICNPAVDLDNSEEETISPTEIAKSYMGTRSSKGSPSTLNLRSGIVQEDASLSTVPHAKKSSAALVTSTPSVHFSGIPEQYKIGFTTPRSRGRSALYKNSRSAYFKVGRPVGDGLASLSTSSPLVPPNYMLMSGKQALKRRSSELDSDFGECDPIRRIRQKSNLMSPSSERQVQKSNLMSPSSERHLPPPANLLTSLSTLLDQGATQQTFSSFPPIPPQSIEMAMKIFEELDKLTPSPKEKTSEMKGSDNWDTISGSPRPSVRFSNLPKRDGIKNNEQLENFVTGIKEMHETVAMDSSIKSSVDVKSSVKIAATANSDLAAIRTQKVPTHQTTLTEESLGLDGKYSVDSGSNLAVIGDNKLPEAPHTVLSKNTGNDKISVKPLSKSSKDVPSFSFVGEDTCVRASDSSIAKVGMLEATGSDEGVNAWKDVDLPRSFGKKITSSGFSAATSSVFGTSTGQSNGSPSSTSASFPISTSYRTNSSSLSTSSTSSFQFQSDARTGVPISVPQSRDKHDADNSDPKSMKESPSSFGSSDTPVMSSTFLSTNATSYASTISSVFSSTDGSSSLGMTSILSNTTNGSSLSSISSTAPTPNGVSGFSASPQSSNSSSSFANSSFSNLGSFSGRTDGFKFSTQPTPPASGSSIISAPTFGLNASSSPSPGISPFGGFPSAAGSSSSASATTSASSVASSLMFASQPSSTSSMFVPTSGNSTTPIGVSTAVFSFSSISTTIASASPSFAKPVFGVPMQGQPATSSSTSNFQFSAPSAVSSGGPSSAFQFGSQNGLAASQNPSPFNVTGDSAFSAGGGFTSNLQFGTPAAVASGGSSIFQFGSQQSSTVPQNPSPFSAGGNSGFSAGAGFSVGSGGGGGEKSGRKIFKAKRQVKKK